MLNPLNLKFSQLLKLCKEEVESANSKFSQVLELCKKLANQMLILCKRCAEMCLNTFFQRIQHIFIDFKRNQRKPCIISAHLADFLQKYPLTAADPSTRVIIKLKWWMLAVIGAMVNTQCISNIFDRVNEEIKHHYTLPLLFLKRILLLLHSCTLN